LPSGQCQTGAVGGSKLSITLPTLRTAINPAKTALLLGAGASVPSGAPTGAQLARTLWRKVATSEPESDDLIETASILVRRYSRRAVVEAVVTTLKQLQPTGGLLGLPKFGWLKLFTTNFDRLLETAYKKCGMPVAVIRSNFDFSSKETASGTRLFKMHGCITQDASLGHKASMLLTESDYEAHMDYRQAMFAQLEAALLEGDVLVIGQSLRDIHLYNLVKEVLRARTQGAPGHVYVLVYEKDDLKAPLLEDRGAKIAFGGIDEFVHAMADGFKEPVPAQTHDQILPAALVSSVIDVKLGLGRQPNVARMFNGGPATYADIASGVTFERTRHAELVTQLTENDVLVLVITGAAGVGKTTFSRQLMTELAKREFLAWEHNRDFPFQYEHWLLLETQLKAAGQRGVLLIDECTHWMRATNTLIERLSGKDRSALRVILTANSAQWAPRVKTPVIFSKKGVLTTLSQLEEVELRSLLNLAEHNPQVTALVHQGFKKLARTQQYDILRRKSSADMFVCLKNVFANESLDTILLQEYDDLDELLQEYYRFVAGLEAVGTRVHRQLIIRMLGVSPQHVGAILTGLSGIVDEYDIDPREGIYGWATRHLVIARRITEYKFAGLDELTNLFERIIDYVNPSEPIELQSIRAICDMEFGIGRLGDGATRQKLYRRLTEMAPGERIPWHRLIRELIDDENVDEAEHAIRDAEAAVGRDSPIDRYKVRLLVTRARATKRISEQDRIALLRRAYEMAIRNIDHYQWDKFAYKTLCDVAAELVHHGESAYIFDEAIKVLRDAAERILDPEMNKDLRTYEVLRRQLH
jgi:hypothetical protein